MREMIWRRLNILRVYMLRRRMKARYINAVSAICTRIVKE